MVRRDSVVVLLAVLAAGTARPQAQPEVNEIAWLAGRWQGTAGKAAIEEYWLAPAGGAMIGLGRTIAAERMVAFEFLRIEKRQDGIYYVAQPQGRPPVSFKLTKSTPTFALFENPMHDHPKKITYRQEGPDRLVAIVEGDDRGQHKVQEFKFQRRPAE